MPIYEYRCPDCAHDFELIQKFSDDPARTCPKCGMENVKKLISQTSFVLKGSGWYNDHYGLKSGSGDSAAKGEAKVETKGDAPAPAKTGGEAAPSAPAAAAPAAAAPAPAVKSGSSTPAASS